MPFDQKAYNVKRQQDPEYRKAQSLRHKSWYERFGKTKEQLKRKADEMRRYRNDPKRRARHVARWIANHAVESGKIMKLPCSQCGEINAQKHHPDYSQPLLIVWLCAPCHRQLHAAAEKGSADGKEQQKQ